MRRLGDVARGTAGKEGKEEEDENTRADRFASATHPHVRARAFDRGRSGDSIGDE